MLHMNVFEIDILKNNDFYSAIYEEFPRMTDVAYFEGAFIALHSNRSLNLINMDNKFLRTWDLPRDEKDLPR